MARLFAAVLSSVVAYVPHWLIGDAMGPMTDFMVSTVVGLIAYVGILWWFGRLRGDH